MRVQCVLQSELRRVEWARVQRRVLAPPSAKATTTPKGNHRINLGFCVRGKLRRERADGWRFESRDGGRPERSLGRSQPKARGPGHGPPTRKPQSTQPNAYLCNQTCSNTQRVPRPGGFRRDRRGLGVTDGTIGDGRRNKVSLQAIQISRQSLWRGDRHRIGPCVRGPRKLPTGPLQRQRGGLPTRSLLQSQPATFVQGFNEAAVTPQAVDCATTRAATTTGWSASGHGAVEFVTKWNESTHQVDGRIRSR